MEIGKEIDVKNGSRMKNYLNYRPRIRAPEAKDSAPFKLSMPFNPTKNTIEGDLNQSTTLGYSRVKGLQPLVEWATMTELLSQRPVNTGLHGFLLGH